MQGWISIHREITKHWVWDEKPFSRGQAWIDLILMASHKETKFALGNELVEINKGSFITSELKLMERWGWGKSKTRSFLKLLEDDGMIVKKSDHKKTAINICNYCIWQDLHTTDRPVTDCDQTATKPQPYTINNVNNENTYNTDEETQLKDIKEPVISSKKTTEYPDTFETFYQTYPRPENKRQTFNNWKKACKAHSMEKILEAANNYKLKVTRERTDKQYMKSSSNFLGRDEVYVDYLQENFKSHDPAKDKQPYEIKNNLDRFL